MLGGFGEIDWARGGAFSPRARLGALAIAPATYQEEGLPTRFGLQVARLDLCPFVFFGAVSPCLRGELGRIQGKTFSTAGARLDSGAWAVAELTLSARWAPATPVFFELEGALGPTLVRPTFLFGARELYAVPALSAGGALNAGVHFP
jgi:hypothetical protein